MFKPILTIGMPTYDDYKDSPSDSPSNSTHSIVVEYELCG